jgi:hypothetical protein
MVSLFYGKSRFNSLNLFAGAFIVPGIPPVLSPPGDKIKPFDNMDKI